MRRVLFLSLVLAGACGPSSSSSPDGGGGTDAPVVPGFDYDTGTWQTEVAVDTPGTISHDPIGVFTRDGTLWGSWMEPDVDATSGEDIWEMRRSPSGTWTTDRRTDDGASQAAYNTMATDGGTVHLVYNSRPGEDNDIFYSKHEGIAWSPRLDVTAAEDPVRHDFYTDIAIAPNGDAVIVYISASVKAGGGIESDGEVRVARVSKQGAVIGTPVTVIPTVGGGCFDPSVVVDTDGTVHVAADCGGLGIGEIYYTNDAGGPFVTAVALPGGGSRDDHGVKLELGTDGKTVHAIWNADSGDAECVYAKRPAGGSWSGEVSASNAATADDRACSLAIDGDGAVLAAWHRQNAMGNEDIYFTWSPDGTTFKTPRVVTTGTDATTEWFPDTIAIDPTTGALHILYEHLVPMSDPLNTQIKHATLAPPSP